ncbi:hypothetical protein [Sodalis ligni]|uniref:hypothetical protein n=1 Tax=Sodalis ligni TaxID=2697027 RepID=UPI0020970C17|nr:hypothetical protein [Sodalis ligni]
MSRVHNNSDDSNYDWDFYHLAIRNCDIAVCEANAISNAIGVRQTEPYKAWSTYIFTRICAHASFLMAATPISRWSKREYENWDVSSIAPHVRAIMEGEILFYYISKDPLSLEEWKAKLNVMHLNDCVKELNYFQIMMRKMTMNCLLLSAKRRNYCSVNWKCFFNLLMFQLKTRYSW